MITVAVRRAGVVPELFELLRRHDAIVVHGDVHVEPPLVDAGTGDDHGLATVGVDALGDIDLPLAAGVEREEPRVGHMHVHHAEEHGVLLGSRHLGLAAELHTLACVDEVAGDVTRRQTDGAVELHELGDDLLALLFVGELGTLGQLDAALEQVHQLAGGWVEQDGAGAPDLKMSFIHCCIPPQGRSIGLIASG